MENKELQQIAKLLLEMQREMQEGFQKASEETAGVKRELMTYIESSVEPDIKTIAEGVSTLVNRSPSVDDVAKDVEDLDIRVAAVEGALKIHRKELNDLKKAQ